MNWLFICGGKNDHPPPTILLLHGWRSCGIDIHGRSIDYAGLVFLGIIWKIGPRILSFNITLLCKQPIFLYVRQMVIAQILNQNV